MIIAAVVIRGAVSYPALEIETTNIVLRNLTLKRPNIDRYSGKNTGALDTHSATVSDADNQYDMNFVNVAP